MNRPRPLSRTAAIRAARNGATIRIETLDPRDPLLVVYRDERWFVKVAGDRTRGVIRPLRTVHALLDSAGPDGFRIEPEDAVERAEAARVDDPGTAYEQSLSRRTGATVDQLRAETTATDLTPGPHGPTIEQRLAAADEDTETDEEREMLDAEDDRINEDDDIAEEEAADAQERLDRLVTNVQEQEPAAIAAKLPAFEEALNLFERLWLVAAVRTVSTRLDDETAGETDIAGLMHAHIWTACREEIERQDGC